MAEEGMSQARRWSMVAVCTALQVCLGTVYAWSFFQVLLVKELGWTFTETAVAFSVTIFSLGVSAAGAGMLLPRFGPRRLALAGSVLFSGGYFIAALALHLDSRMLFYIGYGVVGGTGIGFGYVTPVATTAKWFPDSKGLATGIVVMGFGVGAFLLSMVMAPFLVVQTEGDLPFVFLWLGVIFACILIPASLAMRDPPPDFYFSAASRRGPPSTIRNRSGNACCRAASRSCGWSSSSTSAPASRSSVSSPRCCRTSGGWRTRRWSRKPWPATGRR